MDELEYGWLVALNPPGKRIADFGCRTGGETLALMRVLGATEAVGIDKDGRALSQARQALDNLKQQAWDGLCEAYYTDRLPEWQKEISDFVKGLIMDRLPDRLRQGVEETHVRFVEADITKPIGELQSGYFDLAYCKKVLYHVWCDQGQTDVESAVHEMARVVRPGGWVVAVEPLSSSPNNGVTLDFGQFFERAGLIRITDMNVEIDSLADVCSYLYERRQ